MVQIKYKLLALKTNNYNKKRRIYIKKVKCYILRKGGKIMGKNSELIKFIYQNQTDVIDNLIKKANKEIRDELKIINTESVIGNSNNPNEMKKIFDDIEDNYNIKINKLKYYDLQKCLFQLHRIYGRMAYI